MTIVAREKVRAAVERALVLNGGNAQEAIEVASQVLCLSVEAVREAYEEETEA